MLDFMEKMSCLSDEFAACYEMLHPRARVAILAVLSTALKLSTFKIDNEKEVLIKWVPSSCVQGKNC